MTDEVKTVYKIDLKPMRVGGQGQSSERSQGNQQQQPLCQWGQVQGHPGIVTAFMQASNNPVVIMVKEN